MMGLTPDVIAELPHALFIECICEFNDYQTNNTHELFDAARIVGFINARIWGAKINKPQEIISYKWDETDKTIEVKITDNKDKYKGVKKVISDSDWVKLFGK